MEAHFKAAASRVKPIADWLGRAAAFVANSLSQRLEDCHETAQVPQLARRRGGSMAARGACAAAREDAGDPIPQPAVARGYVERRRRDRRSRRAYVVAAKAATTND
jgi:hypothetical protein